MKIKNRNLRKFCQYLGKFDPDGQGIEQAECFVTINGIATQIKPIDFTKTISKKYKEDNFSEAKEILPNVQTEEQLREFQRPEKYTATNKMFAPFPIQKRAFSENKHVARTCARKGAGS